MRTSDLIIQYLGQQLNFIAPRKQILDQLSLTIGQLGGALYRLKLKGWITNPSYGLWKLVRLYRKIRHTKRIVETTDQTSKHAWDCDCEATSEGYVPYFGQPEPPDIPPDSLTKKFGNILNPYLAKSMLEVLGRQGILLKVDFVSIEPTCSPRHFAPPKFCIEGTEWLDDITDTFDPKHEVEVVFQNNVGTLYPWFDSFTVSEEEFT